MTHEEMLAAGIRPPTDPYRVVDFEPIRLRPWWKALAVRVWRYLTAPNVTAEESLRDLGLLSVQVNGDGTAMREYDEAA